MPEFTPESAVPSQSRTSRLATRALASRNVALESQVKALTVSLAPIVLPAENRTAQYEACFSNSLEYILVIIWTPTPNPSRADQLRNPVPTLDFAVSDGWFGRNLGRLT